MWLNHPAGFVCLKPPSCQGLTLIFTKKSLFWLLLLLNKNFSLIFPKNLRFDGKVIKSKNSSPGTGLQLLNFATSFPPSENQRSELTKIQIL